MVFIAQCDPCDLSKPNVIGTQWINIYKGIVYTPYENGWMFEWDLGSGYQTRKWCNIAKIMGTP